MARAILDSHAFVKRLGAAGMPVEQAEMLADEQSRFIGEQLAAKQDVALLRAHLELLRTDTTAMEQRIKDQLTIRLGASGGSGRDHGGVGQAALTIGRG